MEDIERLLKELTLEEKVCLLSGHKSWHSVKIPRLNIPSIFITDGPHGLRKKKEGSKETGLGQTEPSTCFPAASTTGTSWNKDLLFKMPTIQLCHLMRKWQLLKVVQDRIE